VSRNTVLICVSYYRIHSVATEWSLFICVWAIRGKLLYQGDNCPCQYTGELWSGSPQSHCAEGRRTVLRVAASYDELSKATRVDL
jgi:hypothetical protein